MSGSLTPRRFTGAAATRSRDRVAVAADGGLLRVLAASGGGLTGRGALGGRSFGGRAALLVLVGWKGRQGYRDPGTVRAGRVEAVVVVVVVVERRRGGRRSSFVRRASGPAGHRIAQEIPQHGRPEHSDDLRDYRVHLLFDHLKNNSS